MKTNSVAVTSKVAFTKQEKHPWQRAMQDCVTDFNMLAEMLQLPKAAREDLFVSSIEFPLRVPRAYVAKIEKGNSHDPLLRQILPLSEELNQVPGYTHDPLQESQVHPLPGFLQKYQGRALLTLSGACAIHCRYCFRRNFPYEENTPGKAGLELILKHLANDRSINEVILSGGDPMSCADRTIKFLVNGLEEIPHVTRLRIHTRMLSVIPARVTEEFCQLLKSSRLQKVIVLHINHANEMDEEFKSMMQKCREAEATLLNQSVLLRGVNDNVEALKNLSNVLFDSGVLPYYLHLLDKVTGTAHFDVPEETATKIMWELMQVLPGFLVPKLVREIPGRLSKVPISIIPAGDEG